MTKSLHLSDAARRATVILVGFGLVFASVAGYAGEQGRSSRSTESQIYRNHRSLGTCNESMARNIAYNSGLCCLRLLRKDDYELVFSGRTVGGDMEIIRFQNIRGCPALMEFLD